MELPTLTSPLQLWWLALLLPLIFWLHLPPRPRQMRGPRTYHNGCSPNEPCDGDRRAFARCDGCC